MSQHDYIIADASGSAFLADLNLAIKALAENNYGTTEPAVMYAHMWWADTTADILKKRNAANTGWISYLTLSTGAPLVTSGTWSGNAVTATSATNAGTSGTFTITGTGFTVNPTATATWKLNNGTVFLSIPIGSITGTSNSISFSLTGLPAGIRPATENKVLSVLHGADNGTYTTVYGLVATTGVISLDKVYTTPWTNSGTKALYTTQLSWVI